ncbi:MAG: hypothetical protein ACQEXV_14655 [Bacillota bacterium]
MKKILVTMLVVMLVAIGLNPASSYADSSSSSSAKDSSPQSLFPPYSSIVNSNSLLSGLTPEEYNEVIKNATPIESIAVEKGKTQIDQKISPMASLAAWSFSHHSRNDGAVFSNKFSVNNATNLNFHVVQWADGSSWSSPEVGYLIVNKNYMGEIRTVYGRFTDKSWDFQLRAPGAGEYQIMVSNYNDYTISGNGYVTF